MKSDMFLILSGVNGESVDTIHKNAIEILDLSWSVEQKVHIYRGANGCSGRSDVENIHITKRVDKASPVIRAQACVGHCYTNALIIKRKAGANPPLEYWKLSLKDVIVAHVKSHFSAGHNDDIEVISLSFSEYTEEYVPQNQIGSGLGAVKQGYNLVANKKT